MKTIANLIDGLNGLIGETLKWFVPLVALLCAFVAILRYGFDIGIPWLSESYVWLNAVVFTVGAAYVLLMEKHVRVDFLYNRLGPRGQAWINIFGTVVLLWPTMFFVAVRAWPGIQRSWRIQETSSTIGGLPFMYLLKSCLLVFCVLLALQGLSLVIRSILVLQGRSGDHSPHAGGRACESPDEPPHAGRPER